MPDGILGVVYATGGVISILGAFGVAWALVRGSYNQARIKALREDNEDLRNRIRDLEHAEERHRLKEQAWDKEREHLMAENATLMLAITQRAEVEAVRVQLVQHHDQAMGTLGEIQQILQTLSDRGGS